MIPVRKAVFPVGGLGTRFLPATKAMPKEMLPVVDKPLIQYAVEEARAAGIEQIIFVTGRGKQSIEDHFDYAVSLVNFLAERGKNAEIKILKAIHGNPGDVSYTRQQEPLGLGHAIWCARKLVAGEPFAVLLADDLILSHNSCLAKMVETYNRLGGNVVAAMEVPKAHTGHYGIIDEAMRSGALAEVRGLVEKPSPEQAPSTTAVIGRYILQPEIFDELEKIHPGAGGEIQLTDAMAKLIGKQPFHAFHFEGIRFDCGYKAGYVSANIAFALAREELKVPVRNYLNKLSNAGVLDPDGDIFTINLNLD